MDQNKNHQLKTLAMEICEEATRSTIENSMYLYSDINNATATKSSAKELPDHTWRIRLRKNRRLHDP
jgi:hypothetical protein